MYTRECAQTLGEGESGTARLEEAVAALRAALQGRTRERVPLLWAATQNDLGIAFEALGERESWRGELEEAVAAYGASARGIDPRAGAAFWASAQNNLGNALQTLGEREWHGAPGGGRCRVSRCAERPASGCRSAGPGRKQSLALRLRHSASARVARRNSRRPLPPIAPRCGVDRGPAGAARLGPDPGQFRYSALDARRADGGADWTFALAHGHRSLAKCPIKYLPLGRKTEENGWPCKTASAPLFSSCSASGKQPCTVSRSRSLAREALHSCRRGLQIPRVPDTAANLCRALLDDGTARKDRAVLLEAKLLSTLLLEGMKPFGADAWETVKSP